jgi:hypothetical protein
MSEAELRSVACPAGAVLNLVSSREFIGILEGILVRAAKDQSRFDADELNICCEIP